MKTIQVPFEFQVKEKQLPPGKYVVKCDSQTQQLLHGRCQERTIWVVVHTIPDSLSEQPKTNHIYELIWRK